MLKVAILLHAAPFARQGLHSALRLGQSLQHRPGFCLHAVGLFGAASLLAVSDAAAGAAATLRSQWLQLAESAGVSLRVCPAALARRGFQPARLTAPFELAGMVETLALLAGADRVLEFH